jgi:YfiH family protein
MPFQEVNGLRYFQFNSLQLAWLDHGLFTRHGGVSSGSLKSLNVGATVADEVAHVQENNRRAMAALNRPVDSTFAIFQVHSAEVLYAKEPRQGEPYPRVDGIVTDKKDVTLVMRFADCVPIMMADPERQVIGMVHAGWLGTVRGAAQAGVAKMVSQFGCDPADLICGIGPAIRQHHYPVGPEVVEALLESFGSEGNLHLQEVDGKPHLDLIGANMAALRRAGVEQLEDSKICTACNLDDWYSHRGQQGRAGRFAGIMGLK